LNAWSLIQRVTTFVFRSQQQINCSGGRTQPGISKPRNRAAQKRKGTGKEVNRWIDKLNLKNDLETSFEFFYSFRMRYNHVKKQKQSFHLA